MRILIFGSTGLLGKALLSEQPKTHQVVGLGSKDADIRAVAQVSEVISQHAPDYIILAAAYTDVDGCETNRQLAWDVNCAGAVHVARSAALAGARLAFLSTDYVFDGAKRTPYEAEDARAPTTVYGKTKADAEEQILQLAPDSLVVRTSWVFGVGGKCFPETMLRLAQTKAEIAVVDDQRGCPTYTIDLARALYLLIDRGARGIVHATNQGDCTWFEFADEIMRQASLAVRILPTTSERFLRPARRPKYSVLSPRSAEKLGVELPPWKDALRRYLAQRSDSTLRVADT